MQWIYSPCKPGLAGLIPGFSSLLDEPGLHLTLAVGGTLNSNTKTHIQKLHLNLCFLYTELIRPIMVGSNVIPIRVF